MKYFKHLLTLIILCSLVLFTNCGEEDAAAIETNSKATLTVTASPSEGGSVSPPGGTYDAGTTVEVTATANTDYSFSGWAGDFEGSSNPVTLTMLTDQTLTANFEFQDADGDGIGDDTDACQETPQGETANDIGCSLSQRDTDEDGVNDDLDACADTPEGTTVDESGCAATFIYLDENGVTVKATEYAVIGESYELDEVSYIVVDREMLIDLFQNGEDLTKVVTSRVTSLGGFLSSIFCTTSTCENIDFNQDISSWDVSNVTDLSNLFMSTNFNQDIGSWDVSNVTDMNVMFYYAEAFNQDIGSWDVSNVESFSFMFSQTESFNQDISNWDVSNAYSLESMFRGATSFNQDLSSWNVSNVTKCDFFSSGATAYTLPKPNFTINCRE